MEAPSPNRGPRRDHAPIDILLLHYTGMTSAAAALERLTAEESKVSSHYLVDEDGVVYRLVPDALRASHAGVSYWAGERDINSRSIGVEIVNPGHEHGYRPFPAAQMKSVLHLSHELIRRFDIPAARVLGHSDVAPARKQDPGELFGWQALAAEGVGLWPQVVDQADPSNIVSLLDRYGYDTETEDMVRLSTIAFQRHFRPARLDGVADSETAGFLTALCRQAGL